MEHVKFPAVLANEMWRVAKHEVWVVVPKQRYASAEEVLRDFAEAERRFAVGNVADDRGRRENIGKIAAEDQAKHP